jgi:hypothetical protein
LARLNAGGVSATDELLFMVAIEPDFLHAASPLQTLRVLIGPHEMRRIC